MWKYLKNTWLCLRFPFLYPRNRFTGLHYNNFKILDFQSKIYKKYHRFYLKKDAPESESKWFRNKTEVVDTYWTNPLICFLYHIVDFWHDYVLQWFHCLTSYTELDMIPEVWKKDFGMDWAKAVKNYLKSHNIKRYRIAQLKEKWGEFDWLYPPGIDQEAIDIEEYFIKRSKIICYRCGKPATKVTPIESYKLFYCDKCAPSNAESIYKQYVYLSKDQVKSLKEELVNIDEGITLTSEGTLATENSEINL